MNLEPPRRIRLHVLPVQVQPELPRDWVQPELPRDWVQPELLRAWMQAVRRVDAGSGLESDWQRHARLSREAVRIIDETPMSSAARETAVAEHWRAVRLEWADRQLALHRGSCFMCCLQPVLSWWARLRIAQTG